MCSTEGELLKIEESEEDDEEKWLEQKEDSEEERMGNGTGENDADRCRQVCIL